MTCSHFYLLVYFIGLTRREIQSPRFHPDRSVIVCMAGFGLDDDFLAMDDETASPPLKQTRSLGRKQCAAHWLPELVDEQGVLAAGSWDDAENVVALWSVRLAQEANEGGEDEAMLDASAKHKLLPLARKPGHSPFTLFTGKQGAALPHRARG